MRARLAATIIVASWALVVVPRTIQSLTAPKLRASVGEAGPGYTHLAQLSKDALTFALLATCVIVVLYGMRDRRSAPVGLLAVALAPWAYQMIRDAYIGTGLRLAVLIYPAVVIAMWLIRPPMESLRVLGWLIGLTAIGCILMAVIDPDSAVFRSSVGTLISEDKQILPWGMLEGYLTQPNNLGQTLAAGLPTIFLVRPKMWRIALVAATCFALVWSASRSALYATAVVAAGSAVLLLARRSSPAIGRLFIVAVASVVVILPLVTHEPGAFTNRGYIWNVSLEAWSGHPWIGNGADWYDRIAATAANLGSTVFHGHNQFVQLLVTGGVVLVILVALQYAVVARRASRMPGTIGTVATAYVVALLGTCMMEVTLAYVDNYSMIIVAAVPTAVVLFGNVYAVGSEQASSEPSGEIALVEKLGAGHG